MDEEPFINRPLRKHSKKPSSEEIEHALYLVRQGYPQSEAAAMIGCNQGRISEALSPKNPVANDNGGQQSLLFP